ncbi:uncharacterized protein LOC120353288 [Nilaparvata lugens]|uniref:uncharacterized protein LOC120353288 n=1 Tax=Nilaparvata lugens TaxID=108931 RepID=UPI00193EC036|nr:uncharacterized protein LOC120353288 [Nilaparvata lugens]XP_039292345.1 uncharacterized protein LOC120353288 [Nilaparvata lugens]
MPIELLFPGHNYLGPGNPIENGEPVDSDDAIAQIHDLAYHYAECAEDIRLSDREAIASFFSDCVENRNWHSAVGCMGIGIKYVVESCVGILYPNDGRSVPRAQYMPVDEEAQRESLVRVMEESARLTRRKNGSEGSAFEAFAEIGERLIASAGRTEKQREYEIEQMLDIRASRQILQ